MLAAAILAAPLLSGAPQVPASAVSTPSKPLADVDLSRAFATRSPWRFTAVQAPPVPDPTGEEESVPGPVRLCLKQARATACDLALSNDMRRSGSHDIFSEPHALLGSRIVRPKGENRPPLLLVTSGSVRSTNGDRLVVTQALAYRRDQDRFVGAYRVTTGQNNNQDTRYIEAGPLRGDIISVEQTENAPFGFWVSVNALTPAYIYKQVLRYRSATRYNDGNALAVIDSEMPNIQQRLGVWRPGAPLPLPAKGCPKPHLVRTELWCD